MSFLWVALLVGGLNGNIVIVDKEYSPDHAHVAVSYFRDYGITQSSFQFSILSDTLTIPEKGNVIEDGQGFSLGG